MSIENDLVRYVARYGGNCGRAEECDDAGGICPKSGLPCRDKNNKAIHFVLDALSYGFGNGYIAFPVEWKRLIAAEMAGVARAEEEKCEEVLSRITPELNVTLHHHWESKRKLCETIKRAILSHAEKAVSEGK